MLRSKKITLVTSTPQGRPTQSSTTRYNADTRESVRTKQKIIQNEKELLDKNPIYKEIKYEINQPDIMNYRLCKTKTYNDMLKTKKPIKFTKELIAQLYEFDLQVDINFSFIDEWERQKKDQQQEAQSTFDDNQSVMNDNISVMEASVFEQNLPFLNKVNEAIADKGGSDDEDMEDEHKYDKFDREMKDALKYLKGIYSISKYTIQNYPKCFQKENDYLFTKISNLTKHSNELIKQHNVIIHNNEGFDVDNNIDVFNNSQLGDDDFVAQFDPIEQTNSPIQFLDLLEKRGTLLLRNALDNINANINNDNDGANKEQDDLLYKDADFPLEKFLEVSDLKIELFRQEELKHLKTYMENKQEVPMSIRHTMLMDEKKKKEMEVLFFISLKGNLVCYNFETKHADFNYKCNKIKRPLCLDIRDQFQLVGDEKGSVVLFSGKNQECYDVSKSPILSIRLLKCRVKKKVEFIEFIYATNDGEVIIYKEMTLKSKNISRTTVYKVVDNDDFEDNVVFEVGIICLGGKIPFNEVKKKKLLFILLTMKQIYVYTRTDKDKFLPALRIKCPDCLQMPPTYCYGPGALPLDNIEQLAYYKSIISKYENDLTIAETGQQLYSTKPNDLHNLFIVSAGQSIHVYEFFDVSLTKRLFIELAQYVYSPISANYRAELSFDIYYLTFLAPSFVVIIDDEFIRVVPTVNFSLAKGENNRILALDTRLYGTKIDLEYPLGKELENFDMGLSMSTTINANRTQTMRNDRSNLDGTTLKTAQKQQQQEPNMEDQQDAFIDLNEMDTLFFKKNEEYNVPAMNSRNRIMSTSDKIIYFGNKIKKVFKLAPWNDSIDLFADRGEWQCVFGICLLINMENNQYVFPNGKNLNEKKNSVFELILIKFANYINSEKNESMPENELLLLLKMGIEFSIKIKKDEYFLDIIFQICDKSKIHLLYDALEHYIKADCFKQESTIPKAVLQKIIQRHIDNNSMITLSELLNHLSMKELNKPEILELIKKNMIINPFINICHNYNGSTPLTQTLYEPIDVMYKYFKNGKSNVNYQSFLSTHDNTLFSQDMLQCKEYIGHKLLWYCNFVLDGKKYKTLTQLDNKEHKVIVIKTTLFLLGNIDTLIVFDSFSYFQLITRIFTEEKLYAFISGSLKEYGDFADKYDIDKFDLKKANPTMFIEHIKKKCLNVEDNFYIMKDFYDFLGEICERDEEYLMKIIDQNLIVNGMKFLVDYKKNQVNHFNDPFSCHHHQVVSKYDEENKKIENILILFMKRITQPDAISNDDKIKISFGLSSYLKAKIDFLTITRNYEESVKLKIELYCKNTKPTKDDKMALFEWIDDSFTNAKNNPSDLALLSRQIINNAVEICKISFTRFVALCEKWLRNHANEISEKLDTIPSDKLKFIRQLRSNLLGQNKSSLLKDEDLQDDESEMSDSISVYSRTSGLSRLSSISNPMPVFNTNIKYESASTTANEVEPEYEYFYDNNNPDEAKIRDEVNGLDIVELNLLCKLKKTNEIFEIIIRNPCLYKKDVLDLLLQHRVYDSAIYIYKSTGDFQTGIDLTVTCLEREYAKMLKNLSLETFRDQNNILLLERHKKMMELGLEICQMSSERNDNDENASEKENWVKMLSVLYKMKANIREYLKQNVNNEKTYYYNKINEVVCTSIDQTLSKICDYITLPIILTILTERIKVYEITFGELKKMLMEMRFSLNISETMFQKIKNLLTKYVMRQFNDYKELRCQGKMFMKGKKCAFCNALIRTLKEKEDLTLEMFYCGHCYHHECAYSNSREEFVCYECKRDEVEKSIIKSRDELKLITQKHLGSKEEKKSAEVKGEDEKKVNPEKEAEMKKREKQKQKLKMKSKKYLEFYKEYIY